MLKVALLAASVYGMHSVKSRKSESQKLQPGSLTLLAGAHSQSWMALTWAKHDVVNKKWPPLKDAISIDISIA